NRDDGYHDLVTIFQATSLVDEVTVAVSEHAGVEVFGEGEGTVPAGSDNLAWRAAVELADYARHTGRRGEPGVRVSIRKAIPVSGGMAGGSADAAATLLG